jgi:hypothetical protein
MLVASTISLHRIRLLTFRCAAANDRFGPTPNVVASATLRRRSCVAIRRGAAVRTEYADQRIRRLPAKRRQFGLAIPDRDAPRQRQRINVLWRRGRKSTLGHILHKDGGDRFVMQAEERKNLSRRKGIRIKHRKYRVRRGQGFPFAMALASVFGWRTP